LKESEAERSKLARSPDLTVLSVDIMKIPEIEILKRDP